MLIVGDRCFQVGSAKNRIQKSGAAHALSIAGIAAIVTSQRGNSSSGIVNLCDSNVDRLPTFSLVVCSVNT
jgi:hypothetical protein